MTISDNLTSLLKSEYVEERSARGVFVIQLPDGNKFILNAAQAVAASIEPHGNSGRSRIRFTLEVEVQAQGDAERYKEHLARSLLEDIRSLEKQLEAARKVQHEAAG